MKSKIRPRGPWQATGMQAQRIPKGDPEELRIRATELKLRAESLLKEADELFARADELERKQ